MVPFYIHAKFYENILYIIKVIQQTRFSLEQFRRDVILQKIVGEVTVLFSAHCLILFYFSTQFHENIFDFF